MSKYIEIENTETLVEAQLQIGKKVISALVELSDNENKSGVIIPISLNGMDFNVTIEKEVADD